MMKTLCKYPNGSVLPLAVVLMVLFLLVLAVVADLGWVCIVKNELQNAADAAALAGVSQLPDEGFLLGSPDQTDDIISCRDFAETFAAHNKAAHKSLLLDRNEANYTSGGIVVGYIANPLDLSSLFQVEGVSEYNSVRVEASLTNALNGPLELLLGAVTGLETIEVRARATATIDDRICGFKIKGQERLDMLPFSLDQDYWNQCLQEYAATGNPIKIYPNDPETPGNFGTIDIGPPDNSASDLVRQIENGISPDDLAAVGGFILEDRGDGVYIKEFQGDTGISNVVGNALDNIQGQDRILPIHANVINPGNNAIFEVCGFVGVRIFDVHMTGAVDKRYIRVEPRIVQSAHAVIDPSASHSHLVFASALTQM
jgi:hypothetical protein